MKCSKCGTELGQKNICPVCSNKKDEAVNVSSNSLVNASPEKAVFKDKSCYEEIQKFLDNKGDGWENAFDQEFGDRTFEQYQHLYSAAETLSHVRSVLLGEIKNANISKLTPVLLINAMKKVQEQYSEIPIDFCRQWFRHLFEQECSQQEALDPIERNILKLRNSLIEIAKEALGETFLDYDQNMEINFIDFGCSKVDRDKLKQLLSSRFHIGFDGKSFDSLFDALLGILAEHCPHAVLKTTKITAGSIFRTLTEREQIEIRREYRSLALTGRKQNAETGDPDEML